MCPLGYHHNGFMATPALGTQEVRLHIGFIHTIQGYPHPELSGCITTLIVRGVEVANFGAAMDTLIDEDGLSIAFCLHLIVSWIIADFADFFYYFYIDMKYCPWIDEAAFIFV